MTWWILTALNHYPTSSTLRVQADTNFADHLFIAWAYHKPARHPIYRTVRGKRILCGYRYIWDTPTVVEQTEIGDTLSHSWHLTGLRLQSTIWYYLFAPDGPYGLEIQGPLMHVTLEWPMPPTARVHRTAAFAVPNATLTMIPFDVADYDTDNMWAIAPTPHLLTCRTPGPYTIKCHGRWQPGFGGRRLLQIMLNEVTIIARTEIGSPALPPAEAAHGTATDYELAVNDTLSLQVYQDRGGPLNLGEIGGLGPHLMATRIGP